MRAVVVASLYGMTYGLQCSDLRTIYHESSCCSTGGDTCLRAIPDCADVSDGAVCFNGQNVELKGLADYLGFETDYLELRKSLIPSQNGQFDIGSADYNIRYVYTDAAGDPDGTVCTQNSDCASNDCRSKCCIATLDDANCGTCGDTGFCETCAAGYSWVSGQGCTEITGDPAGSACTQDSDCASNDCRSKCCATGFDDANCATCGDTGFCEACAAGHSWVSGQGCTAD